MSRLGPQSSSRAKRSMRFAIRSARRSGFSTFFPPVDSRRFAIVSPAADRLDDISHAGVPSHRVAANYGDNSSLIARSDYAREGIRSRLWPRASVPAANGSVQGLAALPYAAFCYTHHRYCKRQQTDPDDDALRLSLDGFVAALPRHDGERPTRSGRGDKGRGDAAVLAEQHIVDAGGGAGRHRFDAQSRFFQPRLHRRRQQRYLLAGSDHENIDRARILREFGEQRRERGDGDVGGLQGWISTHANRRRQDRADMRHASEAKAARAIGVDEMAAGDETVRPRRRRAHPFALAAGARSASEALSLSNTSALTPR